MNYGVLAREQQTVRIVTDKWTHIFTAPLLDPELYALDKQSETTEEYNCSLYSLSPCIASCNSFKPLKPLLLWRVAKAIGAGADFVMLGGMLAGHEESAGRLVIKDGQRILWVTRFHLDEHAP